MLQIDTVSELQLEKSLLLQVFFVDCKKVISDSKVDSGPAPTLRSGVF